MENTEEARIEYLNKYGMMKDYITCSKEDKKRIQIEEDTPDFNNKALIKYLEDKESIQQENECSERIEERERIIILTCFMIESRLNVCIHGFGSKKSIIEQISNLYTEVPKLVVKGYSPASQLQQVLAKLKYIVTKVIGVSPGTGKRSEILIHYLKEAEEEMKKVSSQVPYILIIFHNLDASQYIEHDQIILLSKIFSLKYIRVVCSIDHVRYPITLTPKTLELYNFSFLEYHSHECYLKEFKVGQNIISPKGKEKEGKELKYIMRSLTKVQKEMIQLLAKYVKEKLSDIPGGVIQPNGLTDCGKAVGLTFKQLLEMLIDEMILSSEQQLKENLLEILDHKVFIQAEVQQKTYYTMNYSKAILEKIVDNKLEEEDDEDEDEEDADDIDQDGLSNNDDDDDDNDDEEIDDDQVEQKNSSLNNESQGEEEEEVQVNKKCKRKQRKIVLSSSQKSSSENESYSDNEKQKKNKRGPYKKKVNNKKKASYISESSEGDEEND